MVEVTRAGATTEAIGAAVAVVLAILGLAGLLSTAMMAVTAIVLGAAILLDSATAGARYGRLTRELVPETHHDVVELGGGISAGALAGIAGIVLGILALLGVAPLLLASVTLLIFGVALLFGSAARNRLATLSTTGEPHVGSGLSHRVIHEAVTWSAGGEVLVGMAAVVLGILAILDIRPLTLDLIGFLAVAAVILLGGSVIGARLSANLHHTTR